MKTVRLSSLLSSLTILCLSGVLYAHPGFTSKLEMLNHELEEAPNDQSLYILRGRTYSDKGKYTLAMNDFRQAEKLGKPVNVAFALGILHYRAKEFPLARSQFDRYLKVYPNHPESLEYRARLLRDAGDYKASLADFDRFFALRKNPNPGYYISAAKMLVKLPDKGIPAALEMLDQGIERLGLNPQMQYYAVELEQQRKTYKLAITRMKTLEAMLGESPKWKADLGRLKQKAGYQTQALELYVDARDQLVALRKTPARVDLLSELNLLIDDSNKK